MTQFTSHLPKTDYHRPKPKVRFRMPGTKQYLHLSGTGVTHGTEYAWNGTKAQARALRDRAAMEGQDWPFKTVKRIEVTE
ncbi:hypothetical protein [Pseudosulfitobacter pseudonitzschiae]|uniref:hypothetical protein n=1 Tax=Pseudosulfitobacter pseudonitzschiae TaxID=1402135 RepID=UPI001AFADD46|nr:hypothetical protein [Pseudosulfitobacter pseudonitzschiae]MBM1814525.1 hypothetical protein [Pseudosulfitobacter pseudonitzschiae]MBM1831519.1 hypothetical protein [Pseudosulfitobacter pseudonitzschiae]MBM1836385.1 hypothetical protein [Pseudosulfitobacter pseudonitzschiae]MBM1841231.1 hypothetical protein [Pseudosulfitobacter pseudonitzschiae]MBM1846099.1 hypothetical protein [Pseudosulfitobacter pseudonitzschiae]